MEAEAEKACHSEKFVHSCRGADISTHVAHVKRPRLFESKHPALINSRPNNYLTRQKYPGRDLDLCLFSWIA